MTDQPTQDAIVSQRAREVAEQARTCGDILDDFPCVQCGARSPKQCPLPPSAKIPACDLINSVSGLGNHLRRRVTAIRNLKGQTS